MSSREEALHALRLSQENLRRRTTFGTDNLVEVFQKAANKYETLCRLCGGPIGKTVDCVDCRRERGDLISAPLMYDDRRKEVTREIASSVARQAHLDAVDRWVAGESVILVDDSREGKTMAARYAYNVLARKGESVGWTDEALLFLGLGDRTTQFKPRRWQVYDNSFSPDTLIGYNTKTDEAIRRRLKFRDLIDYHRNNRHECFGLWTTTQNPLMIADIPEDMRNRLAEFATLIEAGK